MLNCKEIKEYIEEKNKIELTPMQYEVLKSIVRGDIVYTARGIGRSLLYNGYADYLKEVIGKDTDRTIRQNGYDSVFTGSMFIHDKIFEKNKMQELLESIRQSSETRFNRDFECKFNH